MATLRAVGEDGYRPVMPKLDAGHRRALKLLADTTDGWTEALLLAYGLSAEFIADLVGAGLATAKAERMHVGGRPIEVTRIRITDAGRAALEPR